MKHNDPSALANPLLRGLAHAQQSLEALTERARAFFYRVMLSPHHCPICGAWELTMLKSGQCRCTEGHVLDPTVAFQRSTCCGAVPVRRMCHYGCAVCGRVVPSRFLFSERIHDAPYFRERMQACRERKQRRLAAWREALARGRSEWLLFDDTPSLGSIPGLEEALNTFVKEGERAGEDRWRDEDAFDMQRYWEVLRDYVLGVSVRFSAMPALDSDSRRDRARRFITLIHMEHEQVVRVTPHGDDLLVEEYEADLEG